MVWKYQRDSERNIAPYHSRQVRRCMLLRVVACCCMLLHVVACCCVLLHVTAVDQDSDRNVLHHFWEALLIVTHLFFLMFLFLLVCFCFCLVFLLFALRVYHCLAVSISRYSSLLQSLGAIVTLNTQWSSRVDHWQRKRRRALVEEGEEEVEEVEGGKAQ